MFDTQYFINVEKGFTVMYGNKLYRVQDDGKGFLHIIVHENGKREYGCTYDDPETGEEYYNKTFGNSQNIQQ